MRVRLSSGEAFVHTGGVEQPDGDELALLIHGAGNDHTVWRYATRRFAAAGIPVAAPDLPAHGATPGPPLHTIGEMAAWCLDLVDALGFEKVVPVGHSMGSLIAMEMAYRAPDRVDRVGLIAPAERLAVHPVLQDAADRLDPLAADLILGWTHTGRSRFGHHPSPGMWMTGMGRRMLEHNAEALGPDLAACAEWDGAVAFEALGKPTFVAVGQGDRMAPARGGYAVAEGVGAAVVEVAAGSHASLYDHPGEVVDPLMQWLADGMTGSD